MADSRYNTLLVIEGETCEQNFFDKFSKIIKSEKNIEIIPFCNDIYELYKHIKELGETTTIDVILHYCDIDAETRNKLKTTKFVNTYLVFDLDIQDGSPVDRKQKLGDVAEMLKLFNDETGEYGKLFINYPMMESYRHFDFTNQNTLEGKTIEVENDELTQYKERVGREGTNKNINNYASNDFCNITVAHLKQANLLINNKFIKPSQTEYENNIIDIQKIHEKQSSLILNDNKMLVLNTSSFIYSEFYPSILKSKN